MIPERKRQPTLVVDYPREPTRLLKRFGLFRAPVDVAGVARELSIEISEANLEDRHSAFLVVKNNKARIFVNQRHHPHRQRFSIAHECGHYLLHHIPSQKENCLFLDEKLDLYYRRNVSTDNVVDFTLERQANRFAAQLLMPEELIEQFIEDQDLDVLEEKAMKKMALAFKVSEQALLIRLLEVGSVSTTV